MSVYCLPYALAKPHRLENILPSKFISNGEFEQQLDEREKLIDLFGNKQALWVLQAGVCIAIFDYTAQAQNWSPTIEYTIPYLSLHIMVIAFVLSEAAE